MRATAAGVRDADRSHRQPRRAAGGAAAAAGRSAAARRARFPRCSRSSATSAGRPRRASRSGVSDALRRAGEPRGPRLRRRARRAVRRGQPRRHRAHAAPHLGDPQPPGRHRRADLPRRPRRLRHHRHHPRRGRSGQEHPAARPARASARRRCCARWRACWPTICKRVVIVDTSNEIAGDGDIPHPGIGRARRMQVPAPELQHAVMIEAVENHMPEVIVIDEIGTEAEALAARTIAERGVQLIATAHGNTLENLLANPTLSDLVGGIQAVTLGDEEARRRGTQKTVLERKAPPTFDVVIEIRDRDRFAVHHDVAEVVDRLLRDAPVEPRCARGATTAASTSSAAAQSPARRRRREPRAASGRALLRIFPYALRRERVERAIRALQVPAVIADVARRGRRRCSPCARSPRSSRADCARASAPAARVHTVASSSPGKNRAGAARAVRPRDAASRSGRSAARSGGRGHRSHRAARARSSWRRVEPTCAACNINSPNAYGLQSQSVGREPIRHVLIRPADA